MRKLLMTMCLALCWTYVSFAQSARNDRAQEGSKPSNARGVNGATSSQTAQIMLACISHPDFEKYYAVNGAGPINVVDFPGSTEQCSKAHIAGRALSFKSNDLAVSGSLSNYFFLGGVSNSGDHIKVSLTYFYNHSAEGYKVVMVDMELIQNGGKYQIVNANFKGDLL